MASLVAPAMSKQVAAGALPRIDAAPDSTPLLPLALRALGDLNGGLSKGVHKNSLKSLLDDELLLAARVAPAGQN